MISLQCAMIGGASGGAVPAIRAVCRELVRELGLLGGRHPAFGCTPTQGHALLELSREPLDLAELAGRLRLDKSTVSRALGALARQQLVRSRVPGGDRRLRRFELTGGGRELADRLDAWAHERAGSALARLDDATRAELLRSVGAYASALRRERLRGDCQLRPVRPDDDPGLLAVIRRVRVEMGALEAGHPVEEPADRQLHRFYAGARSRYLVAARGGSVLGGAGIAPLHGGPEDTCELQRMYLVPETRGLGLGGELLDRCLDAARELGFAHCYLETLERLEPARRLYESRGFRRLPRPLGETGHGHTDAWYLLGLSGAGDVDGPRRHP
jgi:putative acetyltransferase